MDIISPHGKATQNPPPIPLRKCRSYEHIALPNETCIPNHPLYVLMRNAIMQEVWNALPALVGEALNVQLVPAMTKAAMEESVFDSPTVTQPSNEDFKTDITNKLNGYKTQVDQWITIAKDIQNIELPQIRDDVKALTNAFKNTEKTLINKTKQYISTENKVKNELKSLSELKTGLQELTNQKIQVNDIDNAQKFVSAEYDDLNRKVDEMSKDLKKQANKTEHMFNYSRWDDAEFSGVPYALDNEGNEDCKTMIVNICKELHYVLPVNEISTAHRLKQHPRKTGPPSIIVRFKDRDIRNDVFKLRKLTKGKTQWRNYGITKLFINEHLTPDKRKLMYNTKVFTREMERIHGKIYAWTFKGEVYIRKDAENAQKIKINCENDLNDIRSGTISLDNMPINSKNQIQKNAPMSHSTTNIALSLTEYPLLTTTEHV